MCVCRLYHLFLFLPVPPLSCRTPLHAAAFSGHVDCVQLILSHDAPVDSADQSGRTSLMMAAEKGRAGALGTEMFLTYSFNALECVYVYSKYLAERS